MGSQETYVPTRADRIALWNLMILGAIIVVWTLVGAVIRCVELAVGSTIAVPARFVDTVVDAPIGDGGVPVAVSLDSAVLSTDWLPGASRVAGFLEQAALVGATTTVVAWLLLVSRELLRGRIFSRRNTALVATAGITGVIGAAAVPFFGNMVANGAFSYLGDFERYAVIAIEPFPFVLAVFIVAII